MKDRAYIELINKEGRALPIEKRVAARELFEKHFAKYQSYEELYWTIWKMKYRCKDIVDNAGLFLCDSMNIEIKELIANNKDELNINSIYQIFDNIYYLYFYLSNNGEEFEKKFDQAFTDEIKLTIYKTYLEQYVAFGFKQAQIIDNSQSSKTKVNISEDARKIGF